MTIQNTTFTPNKPLPHTHISKLYGGVLGKIIGVRLGNPVEFVYSSAEMQKRYPFIDGYLDNKRIIYSDDNAKTLVGTRRAPTSVNIWSYTTFHIALFSSQLFFACIMSCTKFFKKSKSSFLPTLLTSNSICYKNIICYILYFFLTYITNLLNHFIFL